jgi:signal peptidase I
MAVKILKKRRILKELKAFKKHVKHILVRDDDILSESSKKQLGKIQSALDSVNCESIGTAKNTLEKLNRDYTKAIPAKKWKLIREYAEIIVVALTVAFGVRALYLQPFKIPTSSMQPTLFGIHYVDKKVVPDIPQPLNYALYSTQRAKLITQKEGGVEGFYPPFTKWWIFPWSAIEIGDVKYELPGTRNKVMEYCFSPLSSKPGPVMLPADYPLSNGWLSQGDHLFVNRFSYHFSGPKRGDIVVFTTEGLSEDASGSPLSKVGFYYVKRLIGMPGDRLKIIDNMIYVKTKNSKRFVPITKFNIAAINRIYSDEGGYQGHFSVGRLASGREVNVPENSYFMLGDNSSFSADSRYWGFVPRRNIIGKALFVFWPFSRRWGIADNTPALKVPTVIEKNTMNRYIPAMRLQ